MDLKKFEKVISDIKKSLFKSANFHSAGMLKSHFRGFGLQFKEHQVYTHGDDVRFIDWKLLARTNSLYVKTFEEERNVEIVVICDLSPSMMIGFENISKMQVAVEITSLLYLLAKETGDTVKTILIGDTVKVLPNRKGTEGIALFISELEKIGIFTSSGNYNYSYISKNKKISSLEKTVLLKKYLSRNREVIILSDFDDFLQIENLKTLIYKKNLHCFRVTSPLDEANTLPFTLLAYSSNQTPKDKEWIVQKSKIEEDDISTALGKKIKRISVTEKYLDKFVREMIT